MMCRKQTLFGGILVAFGLGLLLGCLIQAALLKILLAAAAIGLGLLILGR